MKCTLTPVVHVKRSIDLHHLPFRCREKEKLKRQNTFKKISEKASLPFFFITQLIKRIRSNAVKIDSHARTVNKCRAERSGDFLFNLMDISPLG